MNLFWKRLFGSLKSTPKFETQCKELSEAYKRYLNVQQSMELEEYLSLEKSVNSSDFKENKKILTTRKYKDTQEYNDIQKYEKLSKNNDIVLYYRMKDSRDLLDFLDFKKSPRYSMLKNEEEVKKSPELTKFKNFEASKDYQTFCSMSNSSLVKEYEDLKEKVMSVEFKKANEFWSDEKRWDKTKEAEMERRFNELSKNADIQFYLKTDVSKFNEISKYQEVFVDHFKWNTLNASEWDYGFHFKQKELKQNYSFVNELQANTEGENVIVEDGCMRIITKEQQKEALAWSAKDGFVKHTFNYTSGVINASEAASIKYGVVRAKIRFTGEKGISHAFWLSNEEKRLPHINICTCNKNRFELGLFWKGKNAETKYSGTTIKGINPEDFYIYTVVWSEKEIVWYINNLEVFRTKEGVPSEVMFPVLNSFISEGNKGGNGSMDVDYIDVYTLSK